MELTEWDWVALYRSSPKNFRSDYLCYSYIKNAIIDTIVKKTNKRVIKLSFPRKTLVKSTEFGEYRLAYWNSNSTTIIAISDTFTMTEKKKGDYC